MFLSKKRKKDLPLYTTVFLYKSGVPRGKLVMDMFPDADDVILHEVKVGNDQEIAQSERNSNSENRGGKS